MSQLDSTPAENPTPASLDAEATRALVRESYGAVARSADASCCAPTCCGPGPQISRDLGYAEGDLAAVPEGANLGLGCGNPQAIAALQPGEVVIDLGAGGGLDAFLAARAVGPTGRVIGVDMTPDMVALARRNASKAGVDNVEFRLGEIEALPVPDAAADVIVSNCVINLSPDKARVYGEAFRALRPGGRLAISDVVTLAPIPDALRARAEALVGCVAGAISKEDTERLLGEAGFEGIRVEIDPGSAALIAQWLPGTGAERYAASARIQAVRPAVAEAAR